MARHHAGFVGHLPYARAVAARPGPAVGPDYLVAGRYRLRSRLGGGGMGAVWLAYDRLLERDVAVKQITAAAGLDEEHARVVRQQVVREGRIAARLSHDHAVAVYDVALDTEPWLVMEHHPSRSVAQALRTVETLPPFEVAQIGAQIADALAAAHRADVVHRDIKPGNILVADRGAELGLAKISDFGIAQLSGELPDDEDGYVTGTVAYLAPEVARGAPPNQASDVYSLGATLYTAIEGQPPFGLDPDSSALLSRVAGGRIIPPRSSGPLTTVLLQMLSPDPTARPTMVQARDALAAVVLGPGRRANALLGTPIRSTDGGPPLWAARSAGARLAAGPGSATGSLPSSVLHPRPVQRPEFPTPSTKPAVQLPRLPRSLSPGIAWFVLLAALIVLIAVVVAL
ncbi:serine/threonine-protein kinase [Skermania piniformis]